MKQRLPWMLPVSFCALLSLCTAAELLTDGVTLRFMAGILPILLCLLPGKRMRRVSGKRKTALTILACASAAALSGILTGIFRDFGFAKLLVLLAMAFDAYALLQTGEKELLSPWWEPVAFLLSIAAVIRCFLRMEAALRCTAIGCGGLLAGLGWLRDRNRMNQQLGAHNTENQEVLPVPADVKRANRNLLLLFLLGGLLLGLSTTGLFPHVIRGGAYLLSGAVDGVVFIGRGIEKLVAEKPGTSGANPIRATPPPSPAPEPDLELHGKQRLLEELLNSAFSQSGVKESVLAAALLLVCAAAVTLALRRRRRTESREDSDYTDQIEHIRRSRRAPAARKAASRRRKQRYADMKNDRMKLRFVWWMLLKKPPAGWTPALTPKETAALLGTEWKQLAALYEIARYAPENPLPTDTEALAKRFAERVRKMNAD